ncbi:MAG: DUF4910 domain-containing protein [Candidatus Hodarchaeales archaeon]
MELAELYTLFESTINTEELMINLAELVKFHRIQGSQEFLQATMMIKNKLESMGIETMLHSYPSDGKELPWKNWFNPISSDIKKGELYLVKPYSASLISFKEIPMAVITHSNPSTLEAELVDCGKGDTLEAFSKAKGKIAMTTGSIRKIFPIAAKAGVKGLIYYPTLERAKECGFDTVLYDGFWPNETNKELVTSGFSISYNQAKLLQDLLSRDDQPVVLRFDLEAELIERDLHVLEGVIKGNSSCDEEIIYIGHICHPAQGANDNASGSIALLAIATTLQHLIDENKIKPLDRNIRFLWVPEFSGTIQWILNKTNSKKIIACLNLDMVGESPKVIGSPLNISKPSLSTPSPLTALIKLVAEFIRKQRKIYPDGSYYQLNYQFLPFSGGSDHLLFNDSILGVPSVMFGHDDPYHHSSADKIDKVEPFELQTVSILASMVGYFLASPNHNIAQDLSKEILLESISELLDVLKHDNQQLLFPLVKKIVKHKISQLESYYFEKEQIDKLQTLIEKMSQSLDIQEAEPTSPMISRNFKGVLSYKTSDLLTLSLEDKKFISKIVKDHWGGIIFELMNLANNQYSKIQIASLLSFQYPRFDSNQFTRLIDLFLDTNLIVESLE